MAASLSLLEIVQTAFLELGLTAPVSVIGSADPQTRQMLALANREGNELYRSYEWTTLDGEHIINVETPLNYTGDVLSNSTIVSNLSSTVGLAADEYSVSGSGMPTAQRVLEIIDATTIRMEMEATGTQAGALLTFAKDTYSLPSDFDHYISHTWWDRTNHWMLIGPTSPQFDQWQRSGVVTTGPRVRWRQIGKRPNVFRLWPPPTASTTPDALVFEFISDGWVEHANGTYGSVFTTDTDVSLLNPQMLILGMKWRFWQIKGFAYGAMQQEQIDFVNREKARDGGMPDLGMGRRKQGYLLTSGSAPDGYFPGPGVGN